MFKARENCEDGPVESSSLCLLSGVMRKKGFTFVEIVVVVLILGVITAVTVPRLPFDAIFQKESEVEARRLVTDLRRIQSMALRDAAINSKGYEMVMENTGVTAGYRIDNLDSHEIVDTHTFNEHATVTAGGLKYSFGPMGNLTKGQGTEITVSYGTKSYTISFVAATGTVILTKD
ncbi:MAG: prepilin-type N-terminal cleavage/methylation domain-containing protein [Phycisphaerae bacterium]|nr:prepilin-type N-terminal cleavage/methylation domain-containing protein [Phycisphaerae bacterium]